MSKESKQTRPHCPSSPQPRLTQIHRAPLGSAQARSHWPRFERDTRCMAAPTFARTHTSIRCVCVSISPLTRDGHGGGIIQPPIYSPSPRPHPRERCITGHVLARTENHLIASTKGERADRFAADNTHRAHINVGAHSILRALSRASVLLPCKMGIQASTPSSPTLGDSALSLAALDLPANAGFQAGHVGLINLAGAHPTCHFTSSGRSGISLERDRAKIMETRSGERMA